MSSICIGHPVLEQAFYSGSLGLREEMNTDNETKAVAVTPGSRKGEISRHMPVVHPSLARQIFCPPLASRRVKIYAVLTNIASLESMQGR